MIRVVTALDVGTFTAFALANLVGYHADDGWEFGEVRRATRVALAPRAAYWQEALDAAGLAPAVKKSGGALLMDVVPQLAPAPTFSPPAAPLVYRTGWQRHSYESLSGFDDILRRFYDEEAVGALWSRHGVSYERAAARLGTTAAVVERVARDFEPSEEGTDLEVRLVPNLLDARGRGYSVSFTNASWLFFGPVETHAQARHVVTHEVLHRWVDPVAEEAARQPTAGDPMPLGRARFRIVADLYPDFSIWIGETVVRALTAWYTEHLGWAGQDEIDAAVKYQERIGFLSVGDIVAQLRAASGRAMPGLLMEAARLARQRIEDTCLT